jgi:hypothetical protein
MDVLALFEHMSKTKIAEDLAVTQLLDTNISNLVEGNIPSLLRDVVTQFYQLSAGNAAIGFMQHVIRHRLLLLNVMMWEWLDGESRSHPRPRPIGCISYVSA